MSSKPAIGSAIRTRQAAGRGWLRAASALLAASCLHLAAPGSAPAAGYLSDLESKADSRFMDATAELPSLAGSYLAAQVAAANNDDDEAIVNYRRAIELDPENNRLRQSLFLALIANGNLDEAISLLEELADGGQNQNVNHLVSAASALKQKSWKRAIAAIDKVQGADLDTMVTLIIGAWAHYGERDIDAALARLGEIDGPEWTAMIRDYHRGLMLMAAGRDAEAIAALEDSVAQRGVAAALVETYVRAIEALARAYYRDGQATRGASVIDEGLVLVNDHPALTGLRKMTESGAAIAPMVTSAQQGAAEILFNVGAAISRQGRPPFAQSHLQLSLFLHPENDVALYALAGVYEQQEKFLHANRYYERIAAQSPFYRRAQLEVGLNYERLEQPGEAEAVLLALVESGPDDLLTVLSLGGLYARQDAFDKAAELYTPAIERIATPEPRHWSIFYRRGISYERTKRWELAEADFKQALQLNPDQADVLNYLGYSWIDMGINLDEGMDLIRKAVELRPNSGYIIDSLGWAHYRLGEYEEAVEHLERALELMPSDPVINDHLGDAYWQVGRKLEATFLWKHALSNDPEEADRVRIEEKLRSGLTH